ncbi:hypothetical protein O181_072800 [Austropuccinia psidii MF-1]|uniref:Uncharacterized protein n=1 Tax=Austropuccinia psidii MF-1 TaxID=1389203 RepID=A0A9Q3F187_9BASI|nr:hypothetical protein [Austropuccinia psidii MF-1]
MLQTISDLGQYQRHATAPSPSNDQISIDIMARRLPEERQWDAKEMDEFTATLKGKSRDKTPQLVEDQRSKLTPDQSQRGNLEHDDQARSTAMPLPNLGDGS